MGKRSAWNDEAMVELRQSTVAKWANNWPGLLLLVCAAGIGMASTGPGGMVASALLGIGGLVLLVRNFRMGVTANAGTVVVHGLFWSRSIPRADVVALDGTTLRWKTTSGAFRRTPITAFTDFLGMGGLPPVTAHNATQLRLLDEFLESGAAPSPTVRDR